MIYFRTLSESKNF